MPGSNAEPSARTSCGNVTLGDDILHLAACDRLPAMSDLANLPRVIRRRRIVGWSSLACWTVALGLTSFALSAITVTARWQLWLGPQTAILGSVGLCVGVTIALLARQFARACGTDLLDRPLLSRRGVCALIIACATVASVILYIAFGKFPNSADEYRIPVPSQDVCPLPALEFTST